MDDLSNCRILLVDDTKSNLDVLIQALKDDYKLGVALNGSKALEYCRTRQPDLILLDVLMPGMDGFDVCRKLKADPATREIPIIFITAVGDPSHKTRGFEIGAVDYITKPFDVTEVKARVKTHLSLKVIREVLKEQNRLLEQKVRERTREIEQTQLELLDRLGLAVEYRDEETGVHIKRMSRFCYLLGKASGLPHEESKILSLASTLHDVGKIGISDEILLDPKKLTPEKREIMQKHTVIGQELLSRSKSKLLQIAEIIAHTHHEKWDGTGYPCGLKGKEIPLYGRIAGVCDVFDALISERPYKPAWPVEKAFDEIESGSGTFFDPDIVRLFLELKPNLKKIMKELQ